MLVMADAGLYSYALFDRYAVTGAALAWRTGASVWIGLLRWLADDSYLALIYTPWVECGSPGPIGRTGPRRHGHPGRDGPTGVPT
jgi:hypothetical protein